MDYHIWKVTLDPENSAQNIEQAAKKYWCGTVKSIKHSWGSKEILGWERKKWLKHRPREAKKWGNESKEIYKT